MSPARYAPLFAAGLLVGTLAFLEIGRRVSLRQAARDGEEARPGLGAVAILIFEHNQKIETEAKLWVDDRIRCR